MRSTRIVSALVAIVLALTMSLAFSAPSATGAAKKPKHDLTVNGKEIGNSGKFKAYGKVTTYKNRKITVQRKIKGGYKFYKKTKTKSNGRFSVGIDGPIGACFKVVVPATKNYKTTKDKVGCIIAA